MPSYEDFKRNLLVQESSGRIGIVNPRGYVGLYQMGEAALKDAGYYRKSGRLNNDWKGEWTGKDGINSLDDFRKSRSAQDNAIDALFEKNIREMKNHNLERFIGTRIITPDGKTIVVTESGMIAGAHIGGATGLRNFLESGGRHNPNDDNAKGQGNSIADYMEKFGGYDTRLGLDPSPTSIDNDTFYTPPTGVFDPANDVEGGGFFDSIGSGLSDAASGIGDFFGQIGSGIGSVFSGVGSVLTAGFSAALSSLPQAAMAALAARFGGGGGGGAAVGFRDTSFENNGSGGGSINQMLLPSAFGLAQAILRSKRGRLEGDLIDILSGDMGGGTGRGGRITTPPYVPDFGNGKPPFVIEENPGRGRRGGITTPPIVPDGTGATLYSVLGGVFDNIIGAAMSRHRTRTTVAESERSREAQARWSMSRSQQQAIFAQMAAAGQRNL